MTSIRPLEAADIAAMQQIDELQHGEAWSHRTFVEEIELDERVHLVLASDDELIGHASAWIDGRSCRITNIAVAAKHAGNGYGSTLLLALLRSALRDHPVANVQLEVRPTNRRAQRLYGRFGFVPAGVERDFYSRSDDRGSRDALVMAVPDVCEDTWRDRIDELESSIEETGAAA